LMVMSTRVLCTALKHSQKTSSTLSACMVHNRCDIWFYLVFNMPLKLRELGGGGDGGGEGDSCAVAACDLEGH
jgi:hypothetical protein